MLTPFLMLQSSVHLTVFITEAYLLSSSNIKHILRSDVQKHYMNLDLIKFHVQKSLGDHAADLLKKLKKNRPFGVNLCYNFTKIILSSLTAFSYSKKTQILEYFNFFISSSEMNLAFYTSPYLAYTSLLMISSVKFYGRPTYLHH